MIATRFAYLAPDDRPADAGFWGCNIDFDNRRFNVEFDLLPVFSVAFPAEGLPTTGENHRVFEALINLVMSANATILSAAQERHPS